MKQKTLIQLTGAEIFRRGVEFLILIMLVVAAFYTMTAFAQDGNVGEVVPLDPVIVTPPPGFEWLGPALDALSSVPFVGEWLVILLKWAGAIGAIFTALSVAGTLVLKTPALIAKWAGAEELAAKIEAFHAKVKPWLDYFAIFNADKNKAAKNSLGILKK